VAPRKPPAPPDLSADGRKLWRDLVAVYDLRPDELPLLAEMARTLDDLEVMRAALRESGPVVEGSKGQPRRSPLLTEIRGSRLVLARLAGQLGLPDEAVAGGAPAAARSGTPASGPAAWSTTWGGSTTAAATSMAYCSHPTILSDADYRLL
jgi:hypothetical protein